MKRIIVQTLLSISLLTFVPGVYSVTEDGGLPGYFLNLGLGTRALSLGRSFTAASDNSSSVYWNPAALSLMDRAEVSVTHVSLFEDSQYNSLAFARPLSKKFSCGLAFIQLYTASIIKRDELNNPLDKLNDTNNAFLLSFGYSVNNRISVGVGSKIVSKSFDDINKNWSSLDLSALYSLTNKTKVGVILQNVLFSGSAWTDGREYLVPMNSRLGIAHTPYPEKLTISVDLNKSTQRSVEVFSGIEWIVRKELVLRGGYDNGRIAAGIGIRLADSILDYALLNHDIGLSHRATLTYKFNKIDFDKHVKQPIKPKPLKKENKYDISINYMKEIPFAIYHLFHNKGISVINIKINNKSAKSERFRINYRFGLKNPDEGLEVIVPGNEDKIVNLIPTISREDIRKIEVVPTPNTIFVDISLINEHGKTKSVYKDKLQVTLLPYDQFTPQQTDAEGNKYDLLDTLLNWITYNDRTFAEVVNKASERGAGLPQPVKIIGFQSPNAFTRRPIDNRTLDEKYADYLSQVKLIYDTLKEDYRITYLNQPIAYQNSQRIKLPFETLSKNGNCIELSVLFASLLESVEIDPVLVIFLEDKHAAIGWRINAEGKEKSTLLETNLFGENFETILARGDELLQKNDLTAEFTNGIPFDSNGIYRKGTNAILLDVKKMRSQIPPSPYIPH